MNQDLSNLQALSLQADNILESFDFEKVQRVMEFMNWTWAWPRNGIPTVSELKRAARDLMNDTITRWVEDGSPEIGTFTSTGGFWVTIDVFGGPTIRLLFSIENR